MRDHADWRLAGAVALVATGVAACGGSSRTIDVPTELGERLPVAAGHTGPAVDPRDTGPGRFVGSLLARFDRQAAMDYASFIDRFYRAPASDGYEEVVERVVGELFAAGYGADDGFELEVLRTGMSSPSWTPRSAVVDLVRVDGEGRPMQPFEVLSFDGTAAATRVMLPEHSPGGKALGQLAHGVEALVEPGMILLTSRRIRDVEAEAKERGAIAIVSDFALPYCIDPTGEERHLDAIFHDSVRPGTELPSVYVSRRASERALRKGTNPEWPIEDRALVQVRSVVNFEIRELRTVQATIRGAERPDEVVHVVAHIDGAGANDNAAGAGAMLHSALLLKRLVENGELPRPRRSLSFVFGVEAQAGKRALEFDTERGREVVAAVVADMIGADTERTGATMLLERGWDPASIEALPPDEHTLWGAGSVAQEDVVPNGLAIVMREALVDVARAENRDGETEWATREHPWEGGSDHDAYLEKGIAACLLWHFTDFAFATSLDRMDHVDPAELRRASVATLAGALAVADGAPGDLDRHLATLNVERQLRLDAVVRADASEELLDAWRGWFDGSRYWLRAICLGEPVDTVPPTSDE